MCSGKYSGHEEGTARDRADVGDEHGNVAETAALPKLKPIIDNVTASTSTHRRTTLCLSLPLVMGHGTMSPSLLVVACLLNKKGKKKELKGKNRVISSG